MEREMKKKRTNHEGHEREGMEFGNVWNMIYVNKAGIAKLIGKLRRMQEEK